jgi:hypothetical protein
MVNSDADVSDAVIENVAVPVFVTLTICGVAVPPHATLPKSSTDGEMVTAATDASA